MRQIRTNLSRPITDQAEAKRFLKRLHKNNEDLRTTDDSLTFLFSSNIYPPLKQRELMKKRMAEVINVCQEVIFDPDVYLDKLDRIKQNPLSNENSH